MSLTFKSIRSGSTGNCLMLWTGRTRVLIDCGIPAQFRCREVLTTHAGGVSDIDAVLVTHLHGDHILYDSLRVFEKNGVVVRPHAATVGRMKAKHFRRHPFNSLKILPYGDTPFTIGDIRFEPIPVRHSPEYLTHGFAVSCRVKGRTRKIAIVTDFCDATGLVDVFRDTDFLYVESNHDIDLLRMYPNPNSHYHMRNDRAAGLLVDVCRESARPPRAIMLAHLSEDRNRRELAIATLKHEFTRQGVPRDCAISVAPRYRASAEIKIGE